MKKIFIFATVLMGCFLTACAKEIPLDDSNNEVVAEYVADLLLRNGSEEYKKLDYTIQTPKATVSPAVSVKPTALPNITATPDDKPLETNKPVKPSTLPTASNEPSSDLKNDLTVNTTPVNLSDIFGFKDVTISLKDSKEYVSYPENALGYMITPQEGKKLYIVTLSAKSNSNKSVKFNLEKKGVTYHLFSNKNWYSSLYTILENDAQYLDVNLDPGKTIDFLVAFEVEEKVNTKDASLVLLQNKNSCELKLN